MQLALFIQHRERKDSKIIVKRKQLFSFLLFSVGKDVQRADNSYHLPVWSASLKAVNNWVRTMISLVKPQDKMYGCHSLTVINKVALFVCGDVCFSWESVISMLLDTPWQTVWVWCVLGPRLGWGLFYFPFCMGGCHFTLEQTLHIWQDISAYLISYSFSVISKCKRYNLNSAWKALRAKEFLNQGESKDFVLR